MTAHKFKKLDVIVALLIAGLFVFSWGAQAGFSWSGTTNTLSSGYMEVENVNVTSEFYWNNANRTVLVSGQNATGATAFVGFDTNLDYIPNYWLCDGTADNIEIQEAIDYVNVLGGGTVYLESGTFYLTYAAAFYVSFSKYCIEMDADNTNLMGDSSGTILKISDGVDIGGTNIDNDFLVMLWIHADNIRVSGITFDGNHANVTAGQEVPIFHFEASYNVEIDHCISQNHYKWFLWGDTGPERWNIHDNTIYGPQNGIAIHNAGKDFLIQRNNIGYQSYTVTGIFVDTCTNVIISDNIIRRPSGVGISVFDGVSNVQIIRNQVTGKSTGGTASGIRLQSKGDAASAVDYVLIEENIFTTLVTPLDYGVNIVDAFCRNNTVKNNVFNGPVTPISDLGTDTRLATKTFQFIEPIGTATFVTSSPTGIDVDAANEGALVCGQLPSDIQQVVRIKIWMVATGGPINAGGQMHVNVTWNAGASNAAYNTASKSWTLASFDGEEADYVANDGNYWVIEDDDVGNELKNLAAGDLFESFVLYVAGADPDGATDGLFRIVEIYYV